MILGLGAAIGWIIDQFSRAQAFQIILAIVLAGIIGFVLGEEESKKHQL